MTQPESLPGRRAVLKCAPDDGSALVTISDDLIGLDNFDLSPLEETNDVGGGGAIGAQGAGNVDPTGGFTVDENARTVGLFVLANGRTYRFERGQRGEAAGMPRQTFKAVLTRTHTFEQRGKRRFTIACEITGPIVEDVYP